MFVCLFIDIYSFLHMTEYNSHAPSFNEDVWSKLYPEIFIAA